RHGAPHESRLLPIRLAIATDLLSEGVNLQRASIVVHLDQPWTPSAREQREGRAARMGSAHDAVHVYHVREPAVVARLTALAARHRSKERSAAVASHPAEAVARVRATIASWRAACPDHTERHAVAAIPGQHDAFVAALVVDGIRRIAVGRMRSNVWAVTDDPNAVLAVVACAHPAGVLRPAADSAGRERAGTTPITPYNTPVTPPAPDEVRRAGAAILRWARRRA